MQHRLGISVFTLAIVFAVLWLLAGCTSTEKSDASVKPTTTTEVSFDEPPTAVTPTVPDGDGVIGGLVERVPSLDGLSYSDIRSQLLGTVCNVIDESDGDFIDVGDTIVESSVDNFEFTYSDAGAIVAAAVLIECPEWQDAAREFANSAG